MAKGIFSGVIWGAVVAGAGAGGLSLAYPDFKPGAAAPEVAALDTVAAPDQAQDGPAQQDVPANDLPAEEQIGEDRPAEDQPVQDQAPMTQREAADAAPALEMEPAPEAEPESAPEVAPDPQEQISLAETGDDAPVVAPQPDEAPVQSPQAPAEPDLPDAAEITPDAAPAPEAPMQAELSPEPAPETDPMTPEPEVAALAQEPDPAPEVAAPPQGTIGDLAPDVTTNRLPAVGADEAEGEASAQVAQTPPPIELFAADFEAEEGKPLMSIVLIDDVTSELAVEALESFPYPLTFAVDAAADGAAERMQAYRSKGFEVMAMATLPPGATASDAEVAFAGYLAAVPEAVAVLEDPGASLQDSRDVSDQITRIVLDSGHGLVLQSNGLNTAQKLARREGVPSATVFRDFDGNGQSASVIRRFLDQAAFKAGQEGAVIMQGRLRAETISALLIWGLADRASRVALVPVSGVLTQADFTR